MIDIHIDKFNNKKRTKNGEVVSSLSNVKEYKILKKSLSNFTTTKYGIGLYRVYLGDIDRDFINNIFCIFKREQNQRGITEGFLKVKETSRSL